jgi:DNA-binding transcriptional ArsR family regulator
LNVNDTLTLTTIEQMRALADPLRVRILEVLGEQPMTTMHAAKRLDERYTKLHHHFAVLEAAGLIEVVESRQNRGTVEKVYQPAARRFAIDRHLFAGGSDAEEAREGVHSLLVGTLEETTAEVERSFAAGLLTSESATPSMITHRHLRLTRAQVEDLAARLQSWIADCAAQDADPGPDTYGLTFALYPLEPKQPEP